MQENPHFKWIALTWNTQILLPTQTADDILAERTARGTKLFREGGDDRGTSQKDAREASSTTEEQNNIAAGEEGEADEDDESEMAEATEPTNRVCVFGADSLAAATVQVKQRERDFQDRMAALLKQMTVDDGYREVKLSPPDVLDTLREQSPHFAEVLDQLAVELAIAQYAQASHINFTPILLDGPPGVGKTIFAQQLADTLQVPFLKVSLGNAQGGFELTGTAMHWSNAAPGRLINLLAMHQVANPVVLLDEVDKLPDSHNERMSACLLDLLEPKQAATMRDDGCGMVFDASKVLFILTSNQVDTISAPLLSRMDVFHVPPPSPHQLVAIIKRIWEECLAACVDPPNVELPSKLVEDLAESGASPRVIARLLRQALGAALMRHQPCVSGLRLPTMTKPNRLGFI